MAGRDPEIRHRRRRADLEMVEARHRRREAALGGVCREPEQRHPEKGRHDDFDRRLRTAIIARGCRAAARFGIRIPFRRLQ